MASIYVCTHKWSDRSHTGSRRAVVNRLPLFWKSLRLWGQGSIFSRSSTWTLPHTSHKMKAMCHKLVPTGRCHGFHIGRSSWRKEGPVGGGGAGGCVTWPHREMPDVMWRVRSSNKYTEWCDGSWSGTERWLSWVCVGSDCAVSWVSPLAPAPNSPACLCVYWLQGC